MHKSKISRSAPETEGIDCKSKRDFIKTIYLLIDVFLIEKLVHHLSGAEEVRR